MDYNPLTITNHFQQQKQKDLNNSSARWHDDTVQNNEKNKTLDTFTEKKKLEN